MDHSNHQPEPLFCRRRERILFTVCYEEQEAALLHLKPYYLSAKHETTASCQINKLCTFPSRADV